MVFSEFCEKVLGTKLHLYQKILIDKMYENEQKKKKATTTEKVSVASYGNKSNVVFFDEKYLKIDKKGRVKNGKEK